MAARVRLLGLAGGVIGVLLALGACTAAPAGSAVPAAPPTIMTVAEQEPIAQGPAVVDTRGAPMRAEWAQLVREVHRALAAGDLDALHRLYAGNDWAGQAAQLAHPAVRDSVLGALCVPPVNLGEGYLYSSPDYQTAFFLDYNPPQPANGELRWRGIAAATSADAQPLPRPVG